MSGDEYLMSMTKDTWCLSVAGDGSNAVPNEKSEYLRGLQVFLLNAKCSGMHNNCSFTDT